MNNARNDLDCATEGQIAEEYKKWLVSAKAHASRIMEAQADGSDPEEDFRGVNVSTEMLRLKVVMSDLETAIPEEAVTPDFNVKREQWFDVLSKATSPRQILWCLLKL